MRRFGLILICILALAARIANAGTYKLVDGTQIIGDPLSLTEEGIEFKQSEGSVTPRYAWDKMSPDALKALYAQTKSAHDRALLQPMVENLPADTSAKPMELVVKPIETPPRPTQQTGIFAVFRSSVGWVIVLVLYGANLFAAYEIARYRGQPTSMVCGLAAVPILGVLSPILFIAMPSKTVPQEPTAATQAQPAAAAAPDGGPAPEAVAQGGGSAAPTPAGAAATPRRAPISMPGVEGGHAAEPPPPEPAFPEPIVFARGEFTFNRRFFETKFPGFFRAVRAEAEKDLVLLLKTSRGDYVGKRITRITPNELYLQTFNNDVTADEMIPFIEVMEAQIRHKDAP